MICLLLIRHGTSEVRKGTNKARKGLNEKGREETKVLADRLRRLGAVPNEIWTSEEGDAKETADVLATELQRAPARVLDGLAIPAPPNWFGRVLDELEPTHPDRTIAVVGNEPRLSLIVAHSTGTRRRPLDRAEAVAIVAKDVADYRRAKAAFEFRTGLSGEPEQLLHDKLHSKTAVTTLLAGFTFAGLVELLTGGPLSDVRAAATILLTISLGLLVASVYVYDQLALPAGFWSATGRPSGKGSGLRARAFGPLEWAGEKFRNWTSEKAGKRRAGFVFHHARENHGEVYAHMVWTWQWIFTPAVAAGFAGFVLLLAGSDHRWALIGATAALVLAAVVYVALRPRLGTD